MTKYDKIIAFLLAIAIVAAAVCLVSVMISSLDTNSTPSPDTTEKDNGEQDYITDEFMLIEADTWGEFANYDIIVHKRTKVMYIIYHTSRGVSIQLLLDADGKPLLYEGEIQK